MSDSGIGESAVVSEARSASNSTTMLQASDNLFVHPWDDMNSLDQNSRTILSSSDGIYLRDSEGNKLMDAPAGMWCVNIGHGRQEMADAIAAQVMQLPYNSPWSLANEPAALLAAKLGELSPGDLNHIFFTTGGSTAVDSALRFVCFRNNVLGKTTKKHFISRVNGYHGSTFLTASCSGKAADKKYVDLDTEHFHYLQNPNPIKRPDGMTEEEFCDVLVNELESLIAELGAERVAAFVAEPVLASGGVVVPPKGYLKRCADVCRANDILVIADEVVTSFGRLGHFFASEAVFGVVPDIITTAKGLTSGYIPMGAALISDQLLQDLVDVDSEQAVFANGFTYSGHPVACVAALKNIEIMEREKLMQHVQEIAPYFQQQLKTLLALDIVADVRGEGLMACVECYEHKPSASQGLKSVGERIDEHCQALGLVVRPIYNMCVMSPPLVINKEQIDDLVSMLRQGIEMTAKDLKALDL